MTQTQRIIPNIWVDREAESAGQFYAESLPLTTTSVDMRYPRQGLPKFQASFAGEALVVAVTVAGTRLSLINAGAEFRPTPAISFMLNFDPLLFASEENEGAAEDAVSAAREALDHTWAALSAEGIVRMELGEYPFSARYGWVEDRYGVNWQLMLSDPAGDPRPFLLPALMFGGPVQDQAVQAADFYTNLLSNTPGGSGIGNRHPYGQVTGPAAAEALAFGEFRLGDQWFVANDMGYDHGFGFTEGVSLELRCADQTEIDRVWEALSAQPEAEVCGWLKDRFGVSWQVVPESISDLMTKPGAYGRMMTMGRLIIDEF